MPVPRPDYISGQYYHIYNRGAHQKPIFQEPENYLFVLRKIKHYSSQFNLTLIAYCLMPSHFHFLIRQDDEHPAGLLPQRVFNSYTKAYNKLYQHSDTLFQSAYRVKTVQTTAHLLHLCRYIHGNPVIHGYVTGPADWPYSNYLEFIGERQGTLYDPQFVIDIFGSAAAYRTFIYEDLLSRNLPEEIRKYLEE
ncbi:MAG: transposase [Chloroflexi bacterium HGW-Chloroflexi-10]|nr:MAG: transposase [Chloroflexi bacterium HGW-Chloroflexi-10]